jgi:siderophore synthetase component
VTAVVSADRAASSGCGDRLVLRVLDTLLREDYRGLRSGGVLTAVPEVDGEAWLASDGLHLPVRPATFLGDYAVRRPLLLRDGIPLTELEEILTALRPDGDAEEQAGFDAFVAECRLAQTAMELHEASRDEVCRRLRAGANGLPGSLRAETLAALTADHPAYPTARARLGLTAADLRAYAPEFAPRFELRWLALPRPALALSGQLPANWPSCRQLGLPAQLDASHLAVPVHPLTWDGPLNDALAKQGLTATARRAPHPYLAVTPTLSMRTVAFVNDPTLHVKLPLPMSTLGARNRRSIVPGTLADADLVQRLLKAILRREPALYDRVLLADEGTYGHAGPEYLGFLVRRYPAELAGARVVPVAALLASVGGGRLLIEELAAEFWGGDVPALFDAYVTLLFRWHTTLWLRYGVALEAHQQNVSLVFDRSSGMRLLYKDNDGPRIDVAQLASALGADAPSAADFADQRILAAHPQELAHVYTTITVHLCAAAVAFGLSERGLLTDPAALVRRRLEESLRGLEAERDTKLLRAAVLDADRLPVKSMVIAGTLRTKQRTGARDINKYYGTTAPNYLRAH